MLQPVHTAGSLCHHTWCLWCPVLLCKTCRGSLLLRLASSLLFIQFIQFEEKNKTYLGSWDLVWTPTTASCLHKKWLFERRQNIQVVVVTPNTTITTQNGIILWLQAGHLEVMLWLTASRHLFLHVIKNKTKRPPSLLVPAIELHHKYAPHKRSDGSRCLSEWASGVV